MACALTSFVQKISLIFSDEAPSGGNNKNVDCGIKSNTLKHSTSLKYSFDNLNSLQNTPNMKILSKINSISSLNDKNLEKFTMGNNNRFLATKSYIDFLNPGSGSSAATSLTFDTQPLGSAKSLKLNADDSISMFWSPTSHLQQQQQQQQEKKQQQLQHRQSLTEKPVSLFWGDTLGSESMVQQQTNDDSTLSHQQHLKQHQLPTNTSTNLRNTVSSSNLALNINYNESQQQQQQQQPPSSTATTNNPTIPMVIPQKFQFNQPQSQPMMNKNSSSGSHDVMISCEQQMLSSRKGSLPHSSSLLTNSSNNNNNNNNQVVASSNNFLEINQSDQSANGKIIASNSNSTNGKHQQQLTAASASSSSSTPAALLSSSAPTSASFVVTSENGSGEKSSSSSTKWPVVASPHQVMMLYMNKLTPYEHHEIYKYSQIFFIGANAKKRPGVGSNNSDYDNENGSYIHIPHDHIAYRYEVLKIIGKGSFGSVVKAYDHKTREHVALKMVRNEKRFHRQAQEEIRILKHLRNQDKENTFNIIHM